MNEEAGTMAAADAKEAASKRTSGIGLWPFTQRQSMDTDHDPRSSDRPRKAGMGGKVKPGQGGKHKHTGSGDLHAGEPPSPLSASAADHSWTPGGFSQPEMTDTYSLSQLSPATIATGTPSGRSKGNSFFKNLSFGSKRRHSRGAASPGVPSSPTLPGATPTHEGSMSFSASASSTSGAAGSQSPADSLCHAGAGAARHASSKLNHHNSSGDADDAEFGSCYSDTMQSPSYAHNEGMFDDTLVLQQHGGYGMSADMSPMANMRHDLPDMFTPGFNQLLGQQCREPDTPQDATAMLEPTLALVGTAQLSQVAQLYAPEAMLLCSSHQAAGDAVSNVQDSSAAAAAAERDAVGTSGGQTLLQMEDVAAPDVPAPEACPAASTAARVEDQQHASAFVSAEDIEVTVDEAETSTAAPAADVQQELGPDLPAASTAADAPTEAFTSTSSTASLDSNPAAAGPNEDIAAPSSPAEPAAAQAAADVHSSLEAPAAAAEPATEPAAVCAQESLTAAEQPEADVAAAAVDAAHEPVCTAAGTAEVLPAAELAVVLPAAAVADAGPVPDAEVQQTTTNSSSSPQSSSEPEQPTAAVDVSGHVSACTSPHSAAQQPAAVDAAVAPAPIVPPEVPAAAAGAEQDVGPTVAEVSVSSRVASPQPADTVQEAGAVDAAPTIEPAAEALEVPADTAQAQEAPEQQQQQGLEPQVEVLAQAPLAAEAAVSSTPGIGEDGCAAGVAPQASACDDLEPSLAAVSSSVREPAAQQDSSSAQQQDWQQVAMPAGGQPEEAAADDIDMHPEAAAAEAAAGTAAAAKQTPVATAEPLMQQDCPDVQIQAEAPAAEPVLAAEPSSEHMLAAEPAAAEPMLAAEPSSELLVAAEPAAAEHAFVVEPAANALLGPSGQQQPELCAPSAAEQQQVGTVGPKVAEEESQLLCPELAGDDTFSLVAEASEEPLVPLGVDSEPGSPTACFSSQPAAEVSSPVLTGPRSARRAGRTPVSAVRESIPLFMSDPSRALGSNLLVEDSLDDQDMQMLTSGTAAGAAAAAGAAGAAAAAAGRLLALGGPQRVALGFNGGLNPLTPVAEGFGTSPIPEETSTGGSSQSKSSSRYEAAAAGSPGSSPVRPLAMAAHGTSPCFGMTPGSTYSTPTLTLGQAGGMAARSQLGGTPASAMSSAVGSAIRDIGSAGRMGLMDRGLSPTMPSGLPNVSPTLNLLPNMGDGSGLGQGGSGDGSTPSLLDGRAASPSAVYSTLYTTTPFRGALEALPISEAVNAPLVDSSPFDLTDDGMFEKCGLAQEAQKVAQNLAAAAAAGTFGGATPFPAVTPGASLQRPMSPCDTDPRAQLADRMASPELTDGLRDMHQQMVIKQITVLERRVKELEGENERLKEQVDIYEFEKTELNSQEEMEKQARQYAEEQLQMTQMQMQGMRQAHNEQHAAMQALKQEFEGLRQEAARKHLQDKEEALALEQRLTQMQDERNQALDRVNLLDMELTAVRSAVNDVQGALQREQQRSVELADAVAAKDKDMADMTRLNTELRSKLEKTMEQLIAAQTAKEHARQQAQEESAKAKQVISQYDHVVNECNALQAAAERREAQWRELKSKYNAKSSTLKETEAKLLAKESEVAELMAMCDQLLQQHGS